MERWSSNELLDDNVLELNIFEDISHHNDVVLPDICVTHHGDMDSTRNLPHEEKKRSQEHLGSKTSLHRVKSRSASCLNERMQNRSVSFEELFDFGLEDNFSGAGMNLSASFDGNIRTLSSNRSASFDDGKLRTLSHQSASFDDGKLPTLSDNQAASCDGNTRTFSRNQSASFDDGKLRILSRNRSASFDDGKLRGLSDNQSASFDDGKLRKVDKGRRISPAGFLLSPSSGENRLNVNDIRRSVSATELNKRTDFDDKDDGFGSLSDISDALPSIDQSLTMRRFFESENFHVSNGEEVSDDSLEDDDNSEYESSGSDTPPTSATLHLKPEFLDVRPSSAPAVNQNKPTNPSISVLPRGRKQNKNKLAPASVKRRGNSISSSGGDVVEVKSARNKLPPLNWAKGRKGTRDCCQLIHDPKACIEAAILQRRGYCRTNPQLKKDSMKKKEGTEMTPHPPTYGVARKGTNLHWTNVDNITRDT